MPNREMAEAWAAVALLAATDAVIAKLALWRGLLGSLSARVSKQWHVRILDVYQT